MENGDSTFIKLYRSEKTDELMKYPPAFVLLCQIALRARRTDKFNHYNLLPGEALIGDFESIGLSRSQYRTACKRLKDSHFITIRTTNRGTVAKLIDKGVFDINAEVEQPTAKPTGSHQIATNKNDNNLKKDNLLIEKKFFFENSDKEKAVYDNQGPLVEIVCSRRWNKYIITGVKNCSGQLFTLVQVQSLVKMFLLKGLETADQYESFQDILTHCIRWICSFLKVSEEDAQSNYRLKDFKLFREILHNPSEAFTASPPPAKKASDGAAVSSELKEIFSKEVTKVDLESVAYRKDGLVWDLRHNSSVNQYLIQSIRSNPPLHDFEIYAIWKVFLMVGLSSYYPNVKHFLDCFSRWMKDKMRESHVRDIRKANMIHNSLEVATNESYLSAMESYSKQNNLITTN